MSTRCPTQVKRTVVTARSLALQEPQWVAVHQEGDAQQRTADGEDYKRCAHEPPTRSDPVECVPERQRPGGRGREHVAGLEDVAVGRGIADREIQVAQEAESRQQRYRQERRRSTPDARRQQGDPACEGEQGWKETELALLPQLVVLTRSGSVGRVPAEDAKIVAPEIAIGRRQCLVDEVRPDRVGEDLRQPEPEVEGARPALPDGTVLGRAVEDRVPVVNRLADVPRRGYGSTSRHDYREAGQHSATLRVTEKGRNRERDHDRREGPERERPNELSSTKCNAERDRRQRPEVASNEHARREQQRNRRQEHRQRLGMEHRRQPKGDRQEAEVAEGAGLEP